MRRLLSLVVVVVLAGFGVACSPQPTPKPTETTPTGIRMVAPTGPVTLGEEVRIIVEIVDDEGPVDGVQVTFDVVSGTAEYPAGFDSDVTDELGTAISLDLQPSAAGTVTLRVATGSHSTSVEIDVVE